MPKGTTFWQSLATPALWQWQGIDRRRGHGGRDAAAPRVTKAVPAAILALLAGRASLLRAGPRRSARCSQLDGNPLVVGPLGGGGAGFIDGIAARWNGISGMDLSDIAEPASCRR